MWNKISLYCMNCRKFPGSFTKSRCQDLLYLCRRPCHVYFSPEGDQACPRTLTYLLIPWSRVLLEKLTGLQLVKKFPAFYGTQKFITPLTSARHLSLSWASSIQSTHPHPTSRISILILSSHLRVGLHSGLLPSGFPTKTSIALYWAKSVKWEIFLM